MSKNKPNNKSESKIDLEELDLSVIENIDTGINKKNKSKSKRSYKGVKNYLAAEEEDDDTNVINIEAEKIYEPSNKQKKYAFGRNKEESKRVGSLPYKDMLAYYVKGEKVMRGGIKHTTSPTYEDIAKKFNCSFSAVNQYAAKHNWVEKRKAYRERITDDFSFSGQMAADINCEILSTSRYLMEAVTDKLKSPTFMPSDESIVERNGRLFVIDDEDNLIPIVEGKQLHYSQVIVNMAKALDTINRICNSTVQVEIDNAYLLEEEKEVIGTEEVAAKRMRQIEQLQQRLEESKK